MARSHVLSLVFALFEETFAGSLINPVTSKCLDLVLHCVDGSTARHCERIAPSSLAAGTNLQLYTCSHSENQQFELLSDGQVRNPVTGLCLDVQAPCTNGLSPSNCQRVAANAIPSQANVQLWQCRKRQHKVQKDSENQISAWIDANMQVLDNQKFSFRRGGALRNLGSGLCLEARGLRDGSSNVQAGMCTGADHQVFELETGDAVARTKELSQTIEVVSSRRPSTNEAEPVSAKRNHYVAMAVVAVVAVVPILVCMSVRRNQRAARSVVE